MIRATRARLAALLLPLLAPHAAPAATPAADPDWHIPLPAQAAAATEPTQPEFRLLAAELARYRAIAEAGGWPSVPDGPPLRVGMRDARVEELRDRLRAGGDYAAEMGADPWFFDWPLDQAVRRLQRRYLLPENGVVDASALAAANVAAADVVAQLEATLERWRWLPRDLGPHYVWVNIPRARLDLVQDGRSTLSMRVVVGHRERPTPSLAGELGRVVFNPTWSVPPIIAVEDLLPRQVEDPGFLERHRIRVYRGQATEAIAPAAIDWQRLGPGRFPYRLVQDAGPGNSLGRIRLSFDNPFDIYLHDTPARGMFGLETRALSSGCVRLEDAAALATALLAGDRPWREADTAAAVAAGRTRTVNLRRPLPVYLVYLTAWTDADGELRLGRDLYGRDARLRAANGGVPR